jgi:hypothetical protein
MFLFGAMHTYCRANGIDPPTSDALRVDDVPMVH